MVSLIIQPACDYQFSYFVLGLTTTLTLIQAGSDMEQKTTIMPNLRVRSLLSLLESNQYTTIEKVKMLRIHIGVTSFRKII
jgi:hypothetical protein